MSSHVIIFWNPRAGSASRRQRVEQLRQKLVEARYEVEILEAIPALKERLRQSGLPRVVVSAGGDGTAELVANYLPPGVHLAILPLGTENLLSKFLQMTPSPDEQITQLVAWIDGGATRTIDVGQIGQGGCFC